MKLMIFLAILLSLNSINSSTLQNKTFRHDLPDENWFLNMLFDKYASDKTSLNLDELENIMSLLGIEDEHGHRMNQAVGKDYSLVTSLFFNF
jgi:hypothetical protein